jgi:LPXTG-motif cell wall-anchored protein
MSLNIAKVTSAVLALAVGLSTTAPLAFAQTNAKASVRVVHASPDAPAVDIYINDRETLSNLSFKRVTAYTALDAGTYTVKVFPVSANGQGNPTLQTQVTLNPGWDYTIAAVGKLENIQARVISDNLNVPGAGKTKVRAYHFSPNAPSVNVGVKDGSTLVRGLAFPNATDYLTVDSGRYNLVVQNASNNEQVLEIPNANLTSNAVQSVFVFGLVGENPALSQVVTTDRKAAGTPATGAEDSMLFMILAAGLVGSAGIMLKKMASVEERIR